MDSQNDSISAKAETPSTPVDMANGQVLAAKSAVKAVENGQGKDVDIAAQIIAEYGDEFDRSWTPDEEKRLIRKVDWMIVPIVSCLLPFAHYYSPLTIYSSLCARHSPAWTRPPSRPPLSTASERT